MPKYCVSLTAKNVESCPLYEKGDKIVITLPEVDMSLTDKVCSFIVAELLSKRMKKEKNLVCEIKENFSNKQSYMNEFGISEGILYCPRVVSEVSFDITIEEPESVISDLEEFTRREDKKELVLQLKKLPILSSVSVNDIFDLLSEIKVKKYNPGDIIIKKGDPGKYFFIVYKGEVEVIHPFKEGVETVIGRLSAGECFGEMSLISGEPVSATIRVCAPSTILMLGHVSFRSLMKKNPDMSVTFLKLLGQRIKSTNQRMSMVVASGMAGQLQTIRFPELIQTLTTTECSGILHVNHQGKQGKVYFQNGNIIDATLLDKNGEVCFYEMLKWNKGDFRFEQKELEHTRTIFCDTMGLLLEGMRRFDEENQLKASDIKI